MENIIGIDLGATQMRAARIEEDEIVFLSTEKTPTNEGYDQVLNKLVELIRSVFNVKEIYLVERFIPQVFNFFYFGFRFLFQN